MVKNSQSTEVMKQMQYNEAHHITPTQIVKDIKGSLPTSKEGGEAQPYQKVAYLEPDNAAFAADPIIMKMSKEQLQKSIDDTTQLMKAAAKKLDFIQAAQYRDEIIRLQKELEAKEAGNA